MPEEETKAYDEQGNLVAKKDQKFHQVGWMINGGKADGALIPNDRIHLFVNTPHGSLSPLYIEVGD